MSNESFSLLQQVLLLVLRARGELGELFHYRLFWIGGWMMFPCFGKFLLFIYSLLPWSLYQTNIWKISVNSWLLGIIAGALSMLHSFHEIFFFKSYLLVKSNLKKILTAHSCMHLFSKCCRKKSHSCCFALSSPTAFGSRIKVGEKFKQKC